MLDESTRTAILRLHSAGRGTRKIARALRISRGAVRKVVEQGTAQPPLLERCEKAAPYREDILALYKSCEGNLVRVHEELMAQGANLSYPALTGYCRRHGIGNKPRLPAGHYDFQPGQEMQHDTSPHKALLSGKWVKLHSAALVLGYSRMHFFQHYPRFNRFYCKVFLSDALAYLGGSCAQCLIDNTHVVVLKGSGRDMVPVPEMEAVAERYDFVFRAHEIGHANRSAHVERSMSTIENSFLAGRHFVDFAELNRRAVEFCDRYNAAYKRHLKASPRQLFALEQEYLKPLPLFVPEVYNLHHRIVDVEGYVTVASNRYSAPWKLIGRRLEVRESKDTIELYDGPRRVASHQRVESTVPTRISRPEHRPPRGQGVSAQKISPEQQQLRAAGEPLAPYAEQLKRRAHGRGTTALRRLLALRHEYPRDAFDTAVRTALRYGLYDLERLERLVLRNIAQEFFVLREDEDEHE
ncbi:MAG: IS21 family transposase [Vicinamibacteria bacterium]